jgi:hypothetical protein
LVCWLRLPWMFWLRREFCCVLVGHHSPSINKINRGKYNRRNSWTWVLKLQHTINFYTIYILYLPFFTTSFLSLSLCFNHNLRKN